MPCNANVGVLFSKELPHQPIRRLLRSHRDDLSSFLYDESFSAFHTMRCMTPGLSYCTRIRSFVHNASGNEDRFPCVTKRTVGAFGCHATYLFGIFVLTHRGNNLLGIVYRKLYQQLSSYATIPGVFCTPLLGFALVVEDTNSKKPYSYSHIIRPNQILDHSRTVRPLSLCHSNVRERKHEIVFFPFKRKTLLFVSSETYIFDRLKG